MLTNNSTSERFFVMTDKDCFQSYTNQKEFTLHIYDNQGGYNPYSGKVPAPVQNAFNKWLLKNFNIINNSSTNKLSNPFYFNKN